MLSVAMSVTCRLPFSCQNCFCLKEELEILYRILEKEGKDEGHPGFLRMKDSHHFALPGWLLVGLFEGAMKIAQ